MELCRSVLIRRSPDEVWDLIADVSRYPEFFRGITRWHPCSEQTAGEGACFRVLMQVGSIEAGGTICTTAWHEPERISWRSTLGTEQWGSWRVEPVADGTRLFLQIGFALRGPLRWPVEQLTGRIVGRNLSATLLAARRLVETPAAASRG